MISIIATTEILITQKIKYDICVISYGPIISKNRSLLVEAFMKSNATDLFFIDSDVGFPPDKFFYVLKRPEELVGGTYPNKTENENDYPLHLVLDDKGKVMCSEDGKLLEAKRLPTGFMRIKRSVIEKMIEAYPKLKWEETWRSNKTHHVLYDFFRHSDPVGKWTGEDYGFCDRWKAIGGQLWLYPDIDFIHIGLKEYVGNYARTLKFS